MTQILASMDLGAPCTENSSKGELRKIRWKVWRSLLKRRPILHVLNNCRTKSQMYQLLSPEEADSLTSNLFCHQTSITMTILAIILQKVKSLALISYWAAKSYEETLVFPGMYTFMLFLFSPANCLSARRHPGIFLSQSSQFVFIIHQPSTSTRLRHSCKRCRKEINIFYIDFLISGRFMNFVSVMQKLAFLQQGGKSLIVFLLPQELQRHLVLCHHLHFTLNAKCLKWTNICFNLIHLLAEMLKRQLTHYIKFSNL